MFARVERRLGRCDRNAGRDDRGSTEGNRNGRLEVAAGDEKDQKSEEKSVKAARDELMSVTANATRVAVGIMQRTQSWHFVAHRI